MLLRIVAPHFVAGAIIENGLVVRCAPILNYMRGWGVAKVEQYAKGKRWVTEVVEE